MNTPDAFDSSAASGSAASGPALDGLRKLLALAETLADGDDAPARLMAGAIAGEIRRREALRDEARPLCLERGELERALHPLAAFQLILDRAGQTNADIDAGDAASVLGALLHASYARIGFPKIGGIL